MVVGAKTGGELLSWREAERLYARPPTPWEIAEAFKEEIERIVPRRLRLAEAALRAMEELLAPNLEGVPEEDRPTAWLLLRLTYGLGALEAKVRRYRQLVRLAGRGRRRTARSVEARTVKERADIVKVCRELGVDLKPRGRYWRARCPFPDHEDKDPSFFVDPATQRFVCYGCGRRGDVIDLVMALRGVGFREALEELGRAA